MRYLTPFLFITSFLGLQPALATRTDSELLDLAQSAIQGDRTGACLQIALIDQEVLRTQVCADPESLIKRRLDFDTAFEIGSVSKTMTAAILAGMMRDHDLTLNDSLASILPAGFAVPDFQEQAITLGHVVTHTSGLPAIPADMSFADPGNPYARLDARRLKAALHAISLESAPGTQFAYSNLAMMLLSLGLSEVADASFDSLLHRYVFDALGMQHSYSERRPKGIVAAQGHNQLGEKVPAWTFASNTQGVGGVRASLNDMIKYAQANLRHDSSPTTSLFTQTHQRQTGEGLPPIGMNWMHFEVAKRRLLMHEGGTGGFSSIIVLDKAAQQAVVILADTALTSVGGLSTLALHILEPSMPLPTPRIEQSPPGKLLDQLAGDYELEQAGLVLRVWHEEGILFVQAQGQPKFAMGYDSHGDFFPRKLDALMRPVPTAHGMTFDWIQGGGVMRAVIQTAEARSAFEIDTSRLTDYVGEYPLFDGFTLNVSVSGNELYIQGTNQAALSVVPVAMDQFARDDVGAEFTFNRDAGGVVISITLRQAGQQLTGNKQ